MVERLAHQDHTLDSLRQVCQSLIHLLKQQVVTVHFLKENCRETRIETLSIRFQNFLMISLRVNQLGDPILQRLN